MPANTITDVDEFTDPVTSPGTAQKANQATFAAGLQAVANRTRNHKNRIDGVDTWIGDQMINVRDHGATGGGTNDDTAGFQAAIDAAYQDGGSNDIGGIVWVPPIVGGYKLTSNVIVRDHVTLMGAYRGMRRGGRVTAGASFGSLISIAHTGDAFTVNEGATVDGLEIWYPNQVTSGTPTSHGWTFKMPLGAHGVTIRNVASPNPYAFILVEADGILIQNVQAWPLSTGIHLGRVADVARIDNVHFNPNSHPTVAQSMRDWVQANGDAVKIDGAEEFLFSNFFAFGYNRGFWFTGAGSFAGVYGEVSNFGLDFVNTGILVSSGAAGVGLTARGCVFSNGGIIPNSLGINFNDTGGGLGIDDRPRIELHGVRFWKGGGYTRVVQMTSGTFGRFISMGGYWADFTAEGIVVDSDDAVVRLNSVEMPSGTRVNDLTSGAADIVDNDAF